MSFARFLKALLLLVGLLVGSYYLLQWFDEYLVRHQPLTLLKSDGPGGLGCDEFKEIYHVLQSTPHFTFDTTASVRDYIMPYPFQKAEDTAYFYRYYRHWQPDIDGVVYLEGKFRGASWAGGENLRYGCQDVEHFEVYRIYNNRKHLLVDFTHSKRKLAAIKRYSQH